VAALDVTGDASVALDIAVTGTTTSNRVHAALYCDENGQNCVDADVSLIGGGGGGGGEVAKFHTYHVTDPSRTCTQIVADANALVGDLSGGETGLGASTFIQDDNGMWQAEFTRGDCSPMSNRPAARITVPVDSDGNPIFGFYQNMGFLPSI
jgi:hypothetical protein